MRKIPVKSRANDPVWMTYLGTVEATVQRWTGLETGVEDVRETLTIVRGKTWKSRDCIQVHLVSRGDHPNFWSIVRSWHQAKVPAYVRRAILNYENRRRK